MSLSIYGFVVYDTPRPASRPRVVVNKKTSLAHAFIPRQDEVARNAIREAWLALGRETFAGPVRLGMAVYLPMPKTMPRKRQATARPITRPDLDNYIKQALDALNHYAFVDDNQVFHIEAGKAYAGQPGVPSVPCWIFTIGEEQI